MGIVPMKTLKWVLEDISCSDYVKYNRSAEKEAIERLPSIKQTQEEDKEVDISVSRGLCIIDCVHRSPSYDDYQVEF